MKEDGDGEGSFVTLKVDRFEQQSPAESLSILKCAFGNKVDLRMGFLFIYLYFLVNVYFLFEAWWKHHQVTVFVYKYYLNCIVIVMSYLKAWLGGKNYNRSRSLNV